jgi:hypothetical protein
MLQTYFKTTRSNDRAQKKKKKKSKKNAKAVADDSSRYDDDDDDESRVEFSFNFISLAFNIFKRFPSLTLRLRNWRQASGERRDVARARLGLASHRRRFASLFRSLSLQFFVFAVRSCLFVLTSTDDTLADSKLINQSDDCANITLTHSRAIERNAERRTTKPQPTRSGERGVGRVDRVGQARLSRLGRPRLVCRFCSLLLPLGCISFRS